MRRAVVTGSASGMGEACAATLAANGFHVDGWDLNGDEPVDVSSTESVAAATARLEGELDAVVLAAGVFRGAEAIEASDADWDFMMGVNAFGVFNCVRALAPRMRRGGSIVVIGSEGGLMGAPYESVYSASKFAVTGFVQAASMELANLGIRINTVCPMYIRTPMTDAGFAEVERESGTPAEESYRALAARVPLGRVAETQDVADTVLYLATEQSRYVTGITLPVTGGAHLRFVANRT